MLVGLRSHSTAAV